MQQSMTWHAHPVEVTEKVTAMESETVKHQAFAIVSQQTAGVSRFLQTATFCGQQGRIFRTVRAILNGQPGISAGQRVVRPTDQY